MPLPDLNIVIVNWNSGRLVECCLNSIAACTQSSFRIGDICVVDNGSEPGLVPAANAVKTAFRLIANPSNRGFAAACNQGAAGGNGSYLLFLNPDTTVLPEALDASLSFLESQAGSHAGVCGVRMLAADGSTARTCARNPIPRRFWFALLGLDQLAPNLFKGLMMRDWDHDESRDVAHVIGAFYLIRREVFNSLRGFDERFFVYLEDLDLSCRVVRAGWSIHPVPASHPG